MAKKKQGVSLRMVGGSVTANLPASKTPSKTRDKEREGAPRLPSKVLDVVRHSGIPAPSEVGSESKADKAESERPAAKVNTAPRFNRVALITLLVVGLGFVGLLLSRAWAPNKPATAPSTAASTSAVGSPSR